MLSLIVDPSLEYPSADTLYSPDEHFPEYPYDHISASKNAVYRSVRDCFTQAGYDRDHFGTAQWNPLGEFIPAGSRVFILCNFANERRRDELLQNYRSRCTHGSVLRALIDYVLLAVGDEGSVCFGNAPTQVCHWTSVMRDTGAQVVLDFYRSIGVSVEARDLRLLVTDATRIGAIRSMERRDEACGTHVDLGDQSLFAELDRRQTNRYRVMNYNPRRTEAFHSHGHHEYVINRQILESDVVISVPKLKTHEKVGITCALKGMVGTVGHKDSLPHHRYGPPAMGGDEYPVDSMGLLQVASKFHEISQRTRPDTPLGSFLRVSYKAYRRAIRRWSPVLDGAWWGNDTAWRMALDLARIAVYANGEGEMQNSASRQHLVLVDGIVGGEKQGPAHSTATEAGVLLFGDDLAAVDFACATVMGFDPHRIPLICEALQLNEYPLLQRSLFGNQVIHNGRVLSFSEFSEMEWYHFEPQSGWVERLRAGPQLEPVVSE